MNTDIDSARQEKQTQSKKETKTIKKRENVENLIQCPDSIVRKDKTDNHSTGLTTLGIKDVSSSIQENRDVVA